MNSVCVIGLGYIGLPTAAMLAFRGLKVSGIDIQPEVVDIVNSGNIHIEEPTLRALVGGAVDSGNLRAYTTPQKSDVYIIAVPTPVGDDKKARMDYVEAAAESIVPLLRAGNLVILESTSPPETTTKLLVPILEKSNLKIGEELLVAYCPEKVLPGRIVQELIENHRIIGGINEKSSQAAKQLYSSFVRGEIFLTDSITAEMVKIVENTYRDVNIALANEFAKISAELGINIWEVIKFTNMHQRVNVHSPGPGVGGHCISVDPWFIVEKYPHLAKLINQAREVNDSMPEFAYNLVIEAVRDIENPKITILGLTYKPDIDDIRESPAMEITEKLKNTPDIRVSVYDPHVKGMPSSLEDALHGSDCILLAVNHREFDVINPQMAAALMRNQIIIDTRNALNGQAWEEAGFRYVLLGSAISRLACAVG